MDARKLAPLTPRDREILKDVILTYILTAEPVSSRSVAKHGSLGLSAATIRNVMADLEEWGYLAQPHTSAGRVPTRAAYHLFIESMMQVRKVPAKERRYIEENLTGVPADADAADGGDLPSPVRADPARSGIVVTPTWGDTCSRRSTSCRCPAAGCSASWSRPPGSWTTRSSRPRRRSPREELVRISNYLTESFAGPDPARDPRAPAAQDGRGAGPDGPRAGARPSSWRAAGSTCSRALGCWWTAPPPSSRSPSWPTCSGCGACSRRSPTRPGWSSC